MSLNISIYNMQTKVSASGKEYNARVCVFTPGQAGRLSDADQKPPFYIRDQKGGQQWIRLEARTITEAKIEAQKAQDVMEAAARGIIVANPADENPNRLKTKIAAYLEEIEANKAPKTALAYRRTMELFQESCRRLNVQDVRREDILAFKTYLKKQFTSEKGGRAVYNNFLNVSVFFKWAKHRFVDMGIGKHDWPAKPERDPEAYTEEEIEAMLNAADEDERLLVKAFLMSGLRSGEVEHLAYGDIDARNSLWKIHPKAGHALKTKGSKRTVPVHESLTAKIMARKKAGNFSDSDLIFPKKSGGPDGHLLRIVKRVAAKAGVTGRVDDHKFRATAITTWLRNRLTVFDVMEYVGHQDTKTVMRYAAKLRLENAENRKKITAPFEQFASMGD